MTPAITIKPTTPMLNVYEIEKTIKWYQDLGFEVVSTNRDICPDDLNGFNFGIGQRLDKKE